MSPANYQRPPKLYRYSDRQWLERALTLGEFRLRPPVESLQIGHLHNSSRASPQLLTLSLSCACDDALYDEFSNSDCCLGRRHIEHRLRIDPEQNGQHHQRHQRQALAQGEILDARQRRLDQRAEHDFPIEPQRISRRQDHAQRGEGRRRDRHLESADQRHELADEA